LNINIIRGGGGTTAERTPPGVFLTNKLTSSSLVVPLGIGHSCLDQSDRCPPLKYRGTCSLAIIGRISNDKGACLWR